MAETTPIRPTDDEARALAQSLIDGARFAALGVIEPGTGAPMVTRIGLTTAPDGVPLTLVSDLSHHTRALRAVPVCSLLLGEPGAKGDPLTHPRLTLQARAVFVDRSDPAHPGLRAHYLSRVPKAKLYIDFGDFHLVRLEPTGAYLNGGFGKAFVLTPEDLAPRSA
jgi:putative heme iron utilization protein